MFKHKIFVNSSTDPMEAEGLLTILRDDEFVRVVDDKGNPVLTVTRALVNYIESTAVHNTHEHVEASADKPRDELLYELLKSVPKEHRRNIRFVFPERYREEFERQNITRCLGKPIRFDPGALSITVEQYHEYTT